MMFQRKWMYNRDTRKYYKVINNFCENDISEIDTDELIRILNIWLENKKKFDKI